MTRRRYLSTAIATDAGVNRLATTCGDFAALLYTWMIAHADDDAILRGTPEELLYQVVPGRRDKTAADIEAALLGMQSAGLVVLTENGVEFSPSAFYRYQTYVPVDKRRSEHPSATARNFSAKTPRIAENAAYPSPSPSLSPSPSNTGGDKRRTRKQAGDPEHSPHNGTASQIRPRKPDPLWDALVLEFGDPSTASERSLLGRTRAELAAAGATAEQIHTRCDEARRRWDGVAFSPQALPKHWQSLAEPSRPRDRIAGLVANARRLRLAGDDE